MSDVDDMFEDEPSATLGELFPDEIYTRRTRPDTDGLLGAWSDLGVDPDEEED